jgi:methanogenic corrinoid protein MtbC1
VLRCGLPRPAELSPTSTLLEVDGVRWLEIGDGLPQPQLVTYVAVDRPVYVALTAPVEDAFGPLQQVSATVGAALPAVPVAVR